MGIKICNLCCGHGHVFEGWFRSDEELEAVYEQFMELLFDEDEE